MTPPKHLPYLLSFRILSALLFAAGMALLAWLKIIVVRFVHEEDQSGGFDGGKVS